LKKSHSACRRCSIETRSCAAARGKALLIHFDTGLSIYSHNQLYGRWFVVKRDRYPTTNRSLRLALHTADHSALLYSASDIAVLDSDQLLQHPFLARIGPDVLDPTLAWRDIARRLLDPRFRNRAVATLYLDQAFVAGIGNYLRSEILFDAGINPRARPADLTRRQVNGLARSTLAISRRAYQTGGVTNSAARVKALQKSGASRSQYRHAVFGRAGRSCYVCNEHILKDMIAARRLYWCPLCQY
jgi:endonuclease-8